MKIATSTRISLWFSGLVILITTVLSFLVNAFFANLWYNAQRVELNWYISTQSRTQLRPWSPKLPKLWGRFSNIIRLDEGDQFFDSFSSEIQARKIFGKDVYKIDNERYLAKSIDGSRYVMDVTRVMKAQQELIKLSLLAVLLSGILGFALSKLLVKNGLRDLHTLHKEISKQEIGNLHVVGNYAHLPEHDEIAELAKTFRSNATVMHQQIHDMKQFISNASHELRTPLMSLSAKNDLVKKTKNYESLVDHTAESVNTMQKLIDWLLMLSQPTNEKEEVKLVHIDEILDGLLQEHKWLRESKQVSVRTQIQATHVETSEFALRTILTNLIQNAYKYVQEGGEITVILDEKQKLCSINNTWSYLSDEEIKHIWKPFWQSDEARTDHDGFGLGLSLVKRLCEQYGYDITVESSKLRWTTFSINFNV